MTSGELEVKLQFIKSPYRSSEEHSCIGMIVYLTINGKPVYERDESDLPDYYIDLELDEDPYRFEVAKDVKNYGAYFMQFDFTRILLLMFGVKLKDFIQENIKLLYEAGKKSDCDDVILERTFSSKSE